MPVALTGAALGSSLPPEVSKAVAYVGDAASLGGGLASGDISQALSGAGGLAKAVSPPGAGGDQRPAITPS